MRSALVAAAVLAPLVLASCQAPRTVPNYVSDTDSLLALRALKGKTAQLGAFESSLKDNLQVACRGMGPMTLQNGQTFFGYVHDAFQKEMNAAGVLSSGSPTVLTGRLESMDFGWGLIGQGDARWAMTVVLRSSNGKTMRISSETSFHGGLNATAFCQNAPAQFMKNVQTLVKKSVSSPEFAGLFE